MRKIEKKMIEAIEQRKPFASGNTLVTIDFNTAHVFLHGNHIASITPAGNTLVNIETLKRYPTVTTKSRLRALGVNVATKNFVTFLDGEEV